MEREFVCTECGVHVFTFSIGEPNDQDICAGCLWCREHPNAPEEIKRTIRGDRTMPQQQNDKRLAELRGKDTLTREEAIELIILKGRFSREEAERIVAFTHGPAELVVKH